MLEDLKIRIADVGIPIEGDLRKSDWEIPPAYRPFMGRGKTDIILRLHPGLPETLRGEKVFDCPPIWTLYRQDETSTMVRIFHRLSGLDRALVLPNHLEKADLYFADESGPFTDPFYGPTMELLMVNYLAKGRGVIMHSCGIASNGRGMLFVGESGAGKSTVARLWAEGNAVEVLSDDRITVRKKGHEFWIYGTPWHGDAKLASPRGVRLERVFFLRHGQKNSVKEIRGIDQVSRLLTSSFPPHWDPQGMAFTLDLFTDLAAHVPCRELAFKPETTTLDLVGTIAR